jgi:hypothetical protein
MFLYSLSGSRSIAQALSRRFLLGDRNVGD